MIRAIAWLAGIGSLVSAVLAVDWTYPELGYAPAAIPLAAAGVGLFALGAAWDTSWRAASASFLLLLVGQASALQLVDAPRYAVYQHYVSWAQLPTMWPWLLMVCLQASVSAYFLLRAWRRGGHPALQQPRRFALLIALALVAFGSAIPTVGASRFAGEILLSLLVAFAALANVILLAVDAPADGLARVDAWVSARLPLAPHHAEESRWTRRFPYLVAAWVVLTTGSIAWVVLEATPHIEDSVSYLFEARYLAEGRLYLPAPPDSAAFEMGHVVSHEGKWFSKYLPGWPAVLALGVLAGMPWLVNPLLAGVSILLTHAFIRRVYPSWIANATVLLLAASPWFLFMSASFMGHPVSLVWTLIALVAIERGRISSTGPLWGAVVGATMGALFLTRPLEGILVAPVLGLWAWKGRSPGWGAGSFLACGVAGILVALLLLPFNQTLTGSALRTPFALWSELNYGPGADVLGFGPEVGIPDWDSVDPVPGHGPFDVLLNTNKNVVTTNVELFGWSFGSLTLLFVALTMWRPRRPDFLFGGIAVSLMAGHIVYWFPGGPDFGARYWYQAIVPLALLTVRGVEVLSRRWQADPMAIPFRRVTLAVAAGCVSALVTFVPWRAWDKYYRYRDIGSDAAALLGGISVPSIVFVAGEDRSDYESVFNLNPIPLDEGGTVIARERDPASRAAVENAFPGRPVYVLRRPAGHPRLIIEEVDPTPR